MTTTRALAAAIVALAFATGAHAKTPEEIASACAAKGPFYKLSAPHKAGEMNAKTGKPFARNSNGVCRLDTAKVRAAIAGGSIKTN